MPAGAGRALLHWLLLRMLSLLCSCATQLAPGVCAHDLLYLCHLHLFVFHSPSSAADCNFLPHLSLVLWRC